jgi:hypothetical protein
LLQLFFYPRQILPDQFKGGELFSLIVVHANPGTLYGEALPPVSSRQILTPSMASLVQ